MVKNNNLKPIKRMIGVIAAVPLAGEAIRLVGATPSIPKGIRDVTQIGVAGGLLGESVKLVKNKNKGGFL